ILAASNSTLLRSLFTANAVYGGLIRRTFFIKPNEVRKPNSLLEMMPYNKSPLIDRLKEIAGLKGQITISKEAVDTYNDWYYQLYKSYKIAGDRTGVLQSLHTSCLKIAMIKCTANLCLCI